MARLNRENRNMVTVKYHDKLLRVICGLSLTLHIAQIVVIVKLLKLNNLL